MATARHYEDELARRRTTGGENRLPPAIAVVVAAVAYALLPDTLLVGPRLVIPGVEIVLLIALVSTNPRRIVRQTRWSRAVSILLAAVMIAGNLVALGLRGLTGRHPLGCYRSRLRFGRPEAWRRGRSRRGMAHDR